MIAKELREQLFNLPVVERRKLAEELWDSIDMEEMPPELKAKLDERAAQLDANPDIATPYEQVLSEMRSREKTKR